jgi:predicted dehydrogenase
VWGPWDAAGFEVEDHAAAFVRFEGGQALQLEVSWALNVAASEETISLSGTEGGLDVFPFRVNKAEHGMLLDMVPAWMPGTDESDWDRQLDDFVDAVRTGREPLVKPEEALQVNQIVDAIYESAATGQAVRL